MSFAVPNHSSLKATKAIDLEVDDNIHPNLERFRKFKVQFFQIGPVDTPRVFVGDRLGDRVNGEPGFWALRTQWATVTLGGGCGVRLVRGFQISLGSRDGSGGSRRSRWTVNIKFLKAENYESGMGGPDESLLRHHGDATMCRTAGRKAFARCRRSTVWCSTLGMTLKSTICRLLACGLMVRRHCSTRRAARRAWAGVASHVVYVGLFGCGRVQGDRTHEVAGRFGLIVHNIWVVPVRPYVRLADGLASWLLSGAALDHAGLGAISPQLVVVFACTCLHPVTCRSHLMMRFWQSR